MHSFLLFKKMITFIIALQIPHYFILRTQFFDIEVKIFYVYMSFGLHM